MAVTFLSSRRVAASTVADRLAEAVRSGLQQSATATLVVSGGTTPKECLELLSRQKLPWERVSVTVTDERKVPTDDELSNERMVRENLLVGNASDARFLPLNSDGVGEMDLPFAAVLVGMGEDGHFASVFPDLPEDHGALALTPGMDVLEVETAVSPVARTTMTLSLLLRAQSICLLAFGAAKRRILDDPRRYPVGRLLSQTMTPVHVFWAP